MKVLDQRIDWEQEYENLRREALQASAQRGHGVGTVSVARNDGLAGSLDGTAVTTALAKYAAGIVRSSVGLSVRSDHTVGQHGVVLHGKRSA